VLVSKDYTISCANDGEYRGARLRNIKHREEQMSVDIKSKK